MSRALIHRFVLVLAAALMLVAVSPRTGVAGGLVADLSRHQIEITSNFTGTSLLLFGAIDWGRLPIEEDRDREREPHFDARDYDIVVVVLGPPRPFVVRKKEEIGGVWVNRQQAVLDLLPSFYALVSTRPPREILLPEELARFPLGLDHIPITWSDPPPAGAEADYRAAVIQSFRDQRLYSERPASLQVMGETLFRTEVYFPVNVPTGRFQAEVFLIRDGVIVARQTAPLSVDKTGLERAIYTFAHEAPAAYGLVAILIAVAAGLLAGTFSRRVVS